MLFEPLALLATALLLHPGQCEQHSLQVPHLPRHSKSIPNDLQSMSIEFAFFPDYAGNKSHPNRFTKNLLYNFKNITGVAPKVRVGGTSQDHANYYPNQEESVQLIYERPGEDQPTKIKYGPAFFESYHTLGDIKFLHGLNMAQNTSIHQLKDAATVACTSLGHQLHLFELGNEWNFAPGTYRPANYSMLNYVNEWNQKSEIVKNAVKKACPGPFPGFMAPSLVLQEGFVNTTWTAKQIFNLGYDKNNLTREICFHNYFGINRPWPPPAWDLQRTLMNHTKIVENLSSQLHRRNDLAYLELPFTLGELNSIAGQGTNGETDVFGAALWLVDFSLFAAEHGMHRLHFHQGLNYRYASWQPIESKGVPPTTRAPYYGQIMVAKTIGQARDTHVVSIPLPEDTESAYAIYNGRELTKLVVTNLRAFNQTTTSRPGRTYSFQVPEQQRNATVERLVGPGSDATGNITFGGVSYDYSLAQGKPVTVGKMETVPVKNGQITIDVPDSSAVLLTL